MLNVTGTQAFVEVTWVGIPGMWGREGFVSNVVNSMGCANTKYKPCIAAVNTIKLIIKHTAPH